MATTNNHQPTGQPAPANDSSLFVFFSIFLSLFTFALLIWLLILYIPALSHHHSPQTLAPITNLVTFTATTLSNTTSATWNLTISLSNPNPKYTIYYNHFNVSLYYSNNSSNNSNIVFVVGDGLGKFVQPVRGCNLLHSNVSFSTRNLGKRDVVESFLEDQKKGSVGVIIEASYSMSFNKNDGWKFEGNFIIGVNVSFEKLPSGNKTRLGFASGLPREFQLHNP